MERTCYKRQSLLEEAPAYADCVTSIHYLFLEAIGMNIPVSLIGNMPRLLNEYDWSLRVIDKTEMQPGDLIFLKHREYERLISHVALAVNNTDVFHCKKEIGSVVQSVDHLFETYEQTIFYEQLRYIDYRDEELRRKHAGYYLTTIQEPV